MEKLINLILWLIGLQIRLARFIIDNIEVPCGYCGDSLDPNDICPSCFPKTDKVAKRLPYVAKRLPHFDYLHNTHNPDIIVHPSDEKTNIDDQVAIKAVVVKIGPDFVKVDAGQEEDVIIYAHGFNLVVGQIVKIKSLRTNSGNQLAATLDIECDCFICCPV